MHLKLLTAASLAVLWAGPLLAQSAPHKPLNLELPPQDLPAAPAGAATTTKPARASSAAPSAASQPGKYYGDTSGRIEAPESTSGLAPCHADTYGKPRVHGSVGMGVIAGAHGGGSYESGTVRYAQAFGSCEHPTGSLHIIIGVGRGQMDGRRWGR